LEKLPNKNQKEDTLEEYRFIANCLSIGLRLDDLKQMEHKEVMKILLCFNETNKKERKEATQADWDALAR
jgi:hypothetical protein